MLARHTVERREGFEVQRREDGDAGERRQVLAVLSFAAVAFLGVACFGFETRTLDGRRARVRLFYPQRDRRSGSVTLGSIPHAATTARADTPASKAALAKGSGRS